jgi:hypothetical protein
LYQVYGVVFYNNTGTCIKSTGWCSSPEIQYENFEDTKEEGIVFVQSDGDRCLFLYEGTTFVQSDGDSCLFLYEGTTSVQSDGDSCLFLYEGTICVQLECTSCLFLYEGTTFV